MVTNIKFAFTNVCFRCNSACVSDSKSCYMGTKLQGGHDLKEETSGHSSWHVYLVGRILCTN